MKVMVCETTKNIDLNSVEVGDVLIDDEERCWLMVVNMDYDFFRLVNLNNNSYTTYGDDLEEICRSEDINIVEVISGDKIRVDWV